MCFCTENNVEQVGFARNVVDARAWVPLDQGLVDIVGEFSAANLSFRPVIFLDPIKNHITMSDKSRSLFLEFAFELETAFQSHFASINFPRHLVQRQARIEESLSKLPNLCAKNALKGT